MHVQTLRDETATAVQLARALTHCCHTASTARVPPTHLSRDTVGQCRGFLLSKPCGWSPSPPVLKGFLKEAGDIGRPGPPKRLGPRSPREGTGGRLKLQPAASSHSSEQAVRVSISNRGAVQLQQGRCVWGGTRLFSSDSD